MPSASSTASEAGGGAGNVGMYASMRGSRDEGGTEIYRISVSRARGRRPGVVERLSEERGMAFRRVLRSRVRVDRGNFNPK